MAGATNRYIAAIPSAWVRRNVLHPCEGGTLLRTICLATLVWPTSMPSLRSSPWILGAPHNGLAPLIWRISWRISPVTAGRPQRCFDFHRQYDLNPARCERITASGRTIARAPYILGNSRQTPPNINLSVDTNRSLLGLARRSTLICCLSTRISASSATRDRNRSLAIPKINRYKFSIGYQHRAILSQLPARLNLRQGHPATGFGGDRDAVSATRRAVGMRVSEPRTGPSTRCRRRDYEGTSSTLGTAVAFPSPYTLQRWFVRHRCRA